MSGYPLSTGEAVQHVLEGRECASEDGHKMFLGTPSCEPRVVSSEGRFSVNLAYAKLRWRLVPTLVKREDALRALATGKTIMRGRVCFEGGPEPWALSAIVWLAECMFDESACWEVLP